MAMRKPREEAELFHTYLRQNGLKKTYQKDLILEAFLNTEGHLSVDDIYALVKKKDRRVGVVTVFRTMKSLTACGIAKEVVLGDGLTRFEHNFRHPAHHHIVCLQCQKAIEYVCPALDAIQDEVIQKYHFQPLHHRFQTYGICEDCRNSRPRTDEPKQDTERVFARDAIRMLLAMAERSLTFYRAGAKRNQDEGGKEVFARMVRAEETYVAELNRKLEEVLGDEKILERTPVFLHFDTKALDSVIPEIPNHENTWESRLDARAAADLVLDLNARTTDFFESYAEKFPDTQGKRMILQFAGREGSHAGRVRQILRTSEAEDASGGVPA